MKNKDREALVIAGTIFILFLALCAILRPDPDPCTYQQSEAGYVWSDTVTVAEVWPKDAFWWLNVNYYDFDSTWFVITPINYPPQ